MTSSPLFSSSGCAVVWRKMPVLPRWRIASPNATCPSSSSSGVTRSWAAGNAESAAITIASAYRRFIEQILSGRAKHAGNAQPQGKRRGRGQACGEKTPPALPALPALSESHFESELELPLLVTRGAREPVRVVRQRRRRRPGGVGRHHRVEPRHLFGVEDVLHLRHHLG